MKIKIKIFFLFIPLFAFSTIVLSQAPEVIVPIGHTNGISVVKFTNDGQYILTGSSDGMIKLWEIASGKEIKTFEGHDNKISHIGMFTDGKHFISTAIGQKICIGNLLTGKIEKEFQKNGTATALLDVLPDDKHYITSSWSENIKICDIATGTTKFEFKGHKEIIHSAAISQNKKYMITYTSNKKMILWDIEKRKKIKSISADIKFKASMAVSNDGQFAATTAMKNSFNIWDLSTGKLIHTVEGFRLLVNHVFFSPDNKSIIACSGYSLTFWDKTGIKQQEYETNGDKINCIAFSLDQKYLLSGASNNQCKLWEINTRKKIKTFTGYSTDVRGVNCSPDKKHLLSRNNKRHLHLWDLQNGRIAKTLQAEHYSLNNIIDFSPDGNQIITDKWPRDAAFINFNSEKSIRILKGHSSEIVNVKYSSSGDTAYSVDTYGGSIMWNVKNGNKLNTAKAKVNSNRIIKIAPKGNEFIISDSKKTIRIHNFKKNSSIRSFGNFKSEINALEYFPDGKQIIVGTRDHEFQIRNTLTGKINHTIKDNKYVLGPIVISKNQQFIAWTSHTNQIHLYDFNKKKDTLITNIHTGVINSLTFSTDNKFIISAASDHTICICDVQTKKEITKLIAINSSDWIAITPDNYYSCSKGALDKMGFRVGMKSFNFEQFDLRFNRPDIILKRLSYAPSELIKAYYQAYQKRLKKMNFTEEMLSEDWHVPEVSIINNQLSMSNQARFINLEIEAWDTKYNLDRINIWVNNVPIYGTNGINLRLENTLKVLKTIKVWLSVGKNKIEVSALNQSGTESLKSIVNIDYNPTKILKPNLYLITIGVSEYANTNMNLEYAAKDANDISTLFKSSKLTNNYNKVHIININNKNATKNKILKTKDSLMQSKVDDQVIIFLAGHGLLDNKLDYYLATYDIDFTNPSEKGLPYNDLENLLDSIPARKKLILIDACHSGEIDKEEELLLANVNTKVGKIRFRGLKETRGFKTQSNISYKNSFELMKELFADLRRGTGAMIISSARGGEFAYEGDDWNNGVFTYSLIEGLKTGNADINKNNETTVSELRNYVFDTVGKLTNGRQNPTSRRENLEFDFRVW